MSSLGGGQILYSFLKFDQVHLNNRLCVQNAGWVANSLDPDQTPRCVWSGSILFATHLSCLRHIANGLSVLFSSALFSFLMQALLSDIVSSIARTELCLRSLWKKSRKNVAPYYAFVSESLFFFFFFFSLFFFFFFFCLAPYTEGLNLQTFVMISCKTICRKYLCTKVLF